MAAMAWAPVIGASMDIGWYGMSEVRTQGQQRKYRTLLQAGQRLVRWQQ